MAEAHHEHRQHATPPHKPSQQYTGRMGGKGEGHGHAVFLMGGGGSGKGAYAAKYMERHNIPKHNEINSDEIKKHIPLFHNEVGGHGHPGLHGPSGPVTHEDYAKYPKEGPHGRDAMEEHIRKTTGFKSSHEFSEHMKKQVNSKGQPEATDEKPFGGGLTHELSSHIAKKHLDRVINDPKQSFLYDATGNKDFADHADKVLNNSKRRVIIHHVSTPREIALKRNQDRKRTPPMERVLETHKKAEEAGPLLKAHVEKRAAEGKDIGWKRTYPWKINELREAHNRGFHAEGRTPGYEHLDPPKKTSE